MIVFSNCINDRPWKYLLRVILIALATVTFVINWIWWRYSDILTWLVKVSNFYLALSPLDKQYSLSYHHLYLKKKLTTVKHLWLLTKQYKVDHAWKINSVNLFLLFPMIALEICSLSLQNIDVQEIIFDVKSREILLWWCLMWFEELIVFDRQILHPWFGLSEHTEKYESTLGEYHYIISI